MEVNLYNKHTNIVGKSTLREPWRSHVLDSIQLSKFLNNKKSKILDMGTGAGLPGIILAINNYTNITLIDSNLKKIKFINTVTKKIGLDIKAYHQRIESLNKKNFDILIARALAKLNKLFFYSQNFLHKNTILIFLKGKNVEDEINEAYNFWDFKYELHNSFSDKRGKIIIIKGLKKINA